MSARPATLKLLRPPSAKGAVPKAPFGLAGFDDTATSIAVELVPANAEGAHAVAEIAAQIPDARDVEAGAFVVLFAAGGSRGILGRLFGGGRALTRAQRATALLARGYEDLGAGIDDASGLDLVWGRSPVA